MNTLIQKTALVATTLLLLMAIPTRQLSAETYFVRMSGNDRDKGTTRDSAFRTVSHALRVFRANDTIYIGAGNYTTNAYISSHGAQPTDDAAIIGDVRGEYTGDAGKITIAAPASHWAIYARNFGRLRISDVEFATTGSATTGSGIYVSSNIHQLEFERVTFRNLRRGLLAINVGSCQFRQVETTQTPYPLYLVRNGAVKIEDSIFNDATLGVYMYGGSELSVEASIFNDSVNGLRAYYVGSTMVAKTSFRNRTNLGSQSTGIDCYRGALEVVSTDFESPTRAIRLHQGESMLIHRVAITNPSDYGIIVDAKQSEIVGLEVDAPSEIPYMSRGFGVRFTTAGERPPRIVDTNIKNLQIGIRTPTTCEFTNTSLTDCHTGLYVSRGRNRLVLDPNSTPRLTRNFMAIRSEQSARAPADLSFRDVEIAENVYGLYARNTTVSMQESRFSKNESGCDILDCPRLAVDRCVFSDNATNSNRVGYGINFSGENVSITRSVFSGNAVGLEILSTNWNRADLSELEFVNNAETGLLVHNARVDINGEHHMVFKANGTDIELKDCDSNISDVEFHSPEGRFIVLFGGEALIRRCTGVGASQGILASNLRRLQIDDVHFEKSSFDGIQVRHCALFIGENISCVDGSREGISIVGDIGEHQFKLTSSVFTGNGGKGIEIMGMAVRNDTLDNIRSTDNGVGLHVFDGELVIDRESKLDFDDNRNGLYAANSNVDITDFDLRGSSYGMTFNGAETTIRDCYVEGSFKGIYVLPGPESTTTISECQVQGPGVIGIDITARSQDTRVVVSNVQAESFSSVGVQMRSGSGLKCALTVDQSEFHDCGTAVRTVFVPTELRDVSVKGCRRNGLDFYFEEIMLDRVYVADCGGAAVYSYADSIRIENSMFDGSLHGFRANYSPGRGQLINTVLSNNRNGVSIGRGSAFQLTNCTIANATSTGLFRAQGDVVVTNSIIDCPRRPFQNSSSGGSLVVDHAVITPASEAPDSSVVLTNEILKNPLFVNASRRDFRLAEGSPAINAGRDMSSVTRRDLLGNERPSFGKFEVGAYEYTNKAGSLRVLDWDETAM